MLLPYRSSNRTKPRLSCGASRCAKSNASMGFSAHMHLSTIFKVLLKCSTSPLHCGWYGVVVICLVESRCPTSFISSLVNWVPWFDRISSGMPTRTKILARASATAVIEMFFRTTALEYLVAKSTTI